MPCGRADHDSCEIIDDLNLEIDNLNGKIQELKSELWKRDSLNVKMVLGLEE